MADNKFSDIKAILNSIDQELKNDEKRINGVFSAIESLVKEGRAALKGDISVDHLKRIFDEIEQGVWVARGDI